MHKSQRLIRLIMIVNAKKSFTVTELAQELGVSPRTISRDLLDLSELGVPLYSIQGRGGGFKLLKERVLPPISFTQNEAIAVYFAAQSLKYFGSLPFGEEAESAQDKFYHYLPLDIKDQIDRLKNKVVIWSPNRKMSVSCLSTLLQALMIKSVVTIEYESADSRKNTRDIQPVGLYSDRGYWYCPAYCFSRSGYRLFRADRIISAALNELITWREDVESKSVFNWQEDEEKSQESIYFSVSLTANGIKKLEPNGRFQGFIELQEDGSGSIRMHIPVNKLEFYTDMIWELGQDAKIEAPLEAIAHIKRRIEEMNSIYS